MVPAHSDVVYAVRSTLHCCGVCFSAYSVSCCCTAESVVVSTDVLCLVARPQHQRPLLGLACARL
eukprot:7019-Heterococcus_DN1.PRE.9